MVGSRARLAPAEVDSGFTLIEVIVALMLMSIVLMAGGGFMIHAMSTSAAMTGRQDAVTVANQVLEQVRAVHPTFDSIGVSPLVYGRGKTDVQNQWLTAGASLNKSDTYTAAAGSSTSYDAMIYQTTGTSTTPTIPFQQTVVLGGETYTVDTLIGTCVRVSTTNECRKLVGAETGAMMFRVVVRVTWTPGAGRTCSGNQCAYGISTLIDPSQDPTFNASQKPVANADTATTPAGTAVTIGVTANDSGDFALSGAVNIITTPASGSLSVSNNIVTFTPTAGFSGTTSFTYTVTDLTNRTSTAATVTVTVTPVGVADTATTTPGASVLTLSVLSNDLGTGLSLVSVTTPSLGTAVISGTSIKYTPSTTASGTDLITYTAKDSSAQQYTSTLTVTVKPIAATAVTTGTCWPLWVKTNAVQTKSLTLTAAAFIGTGPFTLGSPALVSGPSGATITVSGSTLTYKLPANTNLSQQITYIVTDASGVTSAPITMTLKGTCP